jgi:hypothetical protein
LDRLDRRNPAQSDPIRINPEAWINPDRRNPRNPINPWQSTQSAAIQKKGRGLRPQSKIRRIGNPWINPWITVTPAHTTATKPVGTAVV